MKAAYDIMQGLIKRKKSVLNAWRKKPFEQMKLRPTTEKGDIAEDFLAEMIKAQGYKNVEVKKGRRGDYDVALENKVFFEVKVATQDTKNGFQFNGVRCDTDYTHLFCLGVTPDELFYIIINKTDLVNRKYHLTSMARATGTVFKLSLRKKQLNDFASFKKRVAQVIREIPKKK